jgi:putative tryptophan/tyrosine transport system substrate-binding protein
MRRREFITLASGAVAAWPLAAFGKTQRIAFVLAAAPMTIPTETAGIPLFSALFSELRRLGYVEGQNLLIERYSGEGRASQYPDLARDVVSRNPDVIVSIGSNFLTLDFKAATTTIPIVGIMGSPIENGIVPSLARPGGNITGVTVDVGPEQWAKRSQLLQQVLPQATRLAFLQSRALQERWAAFQGEIARRMGIAFVGPPFDQPANEAEYRRVFAALSQNGAEGIAVGDEVENMENQKLIIELAEKSRLPAIYPFKEIVQAGGLMSYGIDLPEVGRRVADVVGEILRGAKPGEIPIFQPTKFELIINLRTAKALGLTVPPELLTTADEVIE